MYTYLDYQIYFEDEAECFNCYTTTLDNQESPLHRSIYQKRVYQFGKHLPSCDINVLNKLEETPLMAALKIRNEDLCYEFVSKILAIEGVSIDIPDFSTDTPLHLAVQEDTPTSRKILDLILEHPKCDVNIKNALGETPIYLAKSCGIVEKLLKKGAVVNSRTRSEMVPLHKQVRDASICKMLLERGAKINVRDINGATPLHKAIWQGCEETVMLLLQHDADCNVENFDRETPLYSAYMNYLSDSATEEIFKRSKPLYYLYVANFYSSRFPEILSLWCNIFTKEDDVLGLLFNLVNLLRNSPDLHHVTCGQLIAFYFLQNARSLSRPSCRRFMKKFFRYFRRSPLNLLLKSYDYSKERSREEIREIVTTVLESGEILDYSDLEMIFVEFGDCELLHEMLRYRVKARVAKLKNLPLFLQGLVKVSENPANIFPGKRGISGEVGIFNAHSFSRYCRLSRSVVAELVETCSCVQGCAKSSLPADNNVDECLVEIHKNSLLVPSLMELSRNALRMGLCRKYKMHTPFFLHEFLNKLELPKPIINFIMMENPFYGNVSAPNYFPCSGHTYGI